MELKITTNPNPQAVSYSSADELGFGKIFTPHMFQMRFSAEEGWHDAEIVPYHNLELDPATSFIHYGASIFEGLKGYYGKDGQLFLFRPDKNMERMNASAERLCMPQFDGEFVINAIKELIKVDRDWVPQWQGTSMYIRPAMFADEAVLGVHVSPSYFFFVILSPVGAYYASGFAPVKIWVESEFVRAAKGGTGFAKVSGNYAASLLAAERAQEKGYTQVLWLDAAERRYIEEVGTMNMFFVIDNTVITAELTGSILPGVTRDSAIHLCHEWGIPVEERPYTIDEVMDAIKEGRVNEAFGTGTAAIVTPVSHLAYKGEEYQIADGQTGPIAQRLFDTLQAIQYGEIEGPEGWSVPIE
ncbi:MAG TPA: branched-chain amino acid aminotransferase [Candidatus Lokiarchaeia archaeon]|nr:branched-chain amino acid aminotransferase [Candidatus Lokiarchaeia archaeon]